MSMKPEQENFDQLRQLLKLKRCELPPPGYFNNFSGRVIARIQAGRAAESAADVPIWQTQAAQWFLGLFGHKPALTGVFAIAMCALLVASAVYSERMAPGTVTLLPAPSQETASTAPAGPISLLASGASLGFGQPPESAMLVSSTNPITSLFDQIQPVMARPASDIFIPSGQ